MNKRRYWTGICMQGLQFMGLGIWGLTLLDWSWITLEFTKTFMMWTVIVGYNIISSLLIWDGSKK